jgi:hypothetical protein
MINKIIEKYEDEPFLKADGLDEAIIGVDEDTMRLIYSVKKCIEILSRDMEPEDAEEHFYFNVSGSYMGEKTPIWCMDNFEEEESKDEPHEVSKVKCDLCNYSWVAVRPEGLTKLECHNCGNMVHFENLN